MLQRRYGARHQQIFYWDCEPYGKLYMELYDKRGGGLGGGSNIKPEEVVFNVLPAGSTSLRMLVVCEKQVRIFEGRGQRDPKSKLWQATWKEGEKFDSSFQEPFQAYQQGEDYYFLTRSGKLYRAAKSDKGPRRMTALWDDPRRPARLVLQDAGSGRLFALVPARPGKPDELSYVELGPRLVFQPYDPTIITRVEKPAEHKLAIEFARFLIAKKLIRLKPEGK